MARDQKYGEVTVAQDSPNRPLNGSDEPVFLLRGTDAATPDAIREYAAAAREHGASSELQHAAEQVASSIETWQADYPERVKVPD